MSNAQAKDRWHELLTPGQQAQLEVVHGALACQNGTLAPGDDYDLITRAEALALEQQDA